MRNKCNCPKIAALLQATFFGRGMKVGYVHSSGHSPVSQIATDVYCILSSTDCPPFLNNSAGTSSEPVDFQLAVWWMARATSERSGGGSRSWYSQPFPFPPLLLYRSWQNSFHRAAIFGASIRFVPVSDWMHCNLGWNLFVIVPTAVKIFREFPDLLANSRSSHKSSNCLFASPSKVSAPENCRCNSLPPSYPLRVWRFQWISRSSSWRL